MWVRGLCGSKHERIRLEDRARGAVLRVTQGSPVRAAPAETIGRYTVGSRVRHSGP